jgi:hypothetical protein
VAPIRSGTEEERTSATIIGVDPHKRSHTAVVLDDAEQITSQVRVAAGPRQVDELVAWAPAGEREWAVANANGLGRLLAQQLVRRGEVVIDVPATLSSRARKLSGHSGRKTGGHDARSVAIAIGILGVLPWLPSACAPLARSVSWWPSLACKVMGPCHPRCYTVARAAVGDIRAARAAG